MSPLQPTKNRRLSTESLESGWLGLVWGLVVLVIVTNVFILPLLVSVTGVVGMAKWILYIVVVPLTAYLFFSMQSPTFTGWITPEGFEVETVWLRRKYIPLSQFIGVEPTRRGYQFVFRGGHYACFSASTAYPVPRPWPGNKQYMERLTAEIVSYIDQVRREKPALSS